MKLVVVHAKAQTLELLRYPAFSVPTLDQEGVKGFEVSIWHGLYAPKGTPKAAMDKLVAALQEGVKDPTVKQRFAELGATTYPPDKATPAALQSMRDRGQNVGEIARMAGVSDKAVRELLRCRDVAPAPSHEIRAAADDLTV